MRSFRINQELMKKKPTINFSMPQVLKDEFKALVRQYGTKRQWMMTSAALLLWLERPNHERDARVHAIAVADMSDNEPEAYAPLIRAAKTIAESEAKRTELPPSLQNRPIKDSSVLHPPAQTEGDSKRDRKAHTRKRA